MKFLDLSTGYSFDGLWTNDQTKGYVFWFPNEQSIGLTYVMPIAIISDNENEISLSIEDNNIFSFVSHVAEHCNVDDYKFDGKPVYSKTTVTSVEKVGDKFIHIFNVACSATDAGEYICKITIGEHGYIRVGADFYGEYEPSYINLSNFGFDIPTSVQKAIYETNVHEDITDDILINRKFKELLSNYWDIIANKGSYKSLLNSLEWFEWDDNLKIKEIFKHFEVNKSIFNDDDMAIVKGLKTKIDDSTSNFIKTAYISLYCSLQNELPSYDNEYNPELANVVFKWSRNDIQLKISLLAQFFNEYFMPIHMSLLHATTEDSVFTNTIKAIHGAEIKHDDCFGSFDYVECNIKDDTSFKLDNVSVQVSNTTVYAAKQYDNIYFGVDVFPKTEVLSKNDTVNICKYYTGPGAIIPIKMNIPNQITGDYIKQTVIDYTTDTGIMNRIYLYDIFKAKNGSIDVNFNFLAQTAQDYTIKFTFILGSSKTITRTIKFAVEDVDNLILNVYKVKSKDDSRGFTKRDFVDTSMYKYFFKMQKIGNSQYMQYLPYMTPDAANYSQYKGIKLNRTVIFDLTPENNNGHIYTPDEILFLRYAMFDDFLEFAKYGLNKCNKLVIKYMIFVSKKFYGTIPNKVYNNIHNFKYTIVRNDLGFYPQFHYLDKVDGNNIGDYTISQYDALCCAAEIADGRNSKDFRYSHLINSVEWVFYNNSTGDLIMHPSSSVNPFIADSTGNALPTGYYGVAFKYSLDNGTTSECRLDSAFIIK